MTEPNLGQLMRFDGQVAVITGAGRGLGREHALLLASRGASVVVNNRSREAAENNVADITAAGGKAVAHVADIGTRAGGESLVQSALDVYGRIDIVVNNAGILEFCEFPDITDALRDEMFNTHFTSAWVVSQAAWPHMLRQRYGRIVNSLSSAGLWGMPNNAHYCAAKGALVGLTKALAIEGETAGIRVNALSVGGATSMTQSRIEDPEYRIWAERAIPPWAAAPPMAVLAHIDCPVNGEMFGACGRWMSHIIIGNSSGYAPTGDYTPESIRDNFAAVMATDELGFYTSVSDHATEIGKRVHVPVSREASSEFRSEGARAQNPGS